MGDPNVFSLGFTKFIGIGVRFNSFNGVLEVYLDIPFIFVGIFFKKTRYNNWFGFI